MQHHETLRHLLCELGLAIRTAVCAGREGLDATKLSGVAAQAGGDTIYAIDKFGEEAILAWFRSHWPADFPVQMVMEGLESELCFPEGKSVRETDWKCILDPVDGTRGLMYDKRAAWALAAIAPQFGDETRLSHTVATAMTELPTIKQWRADQFSATVDGALIATSLDWRSNSSAEPLAVAPSSAMDFAHGFASFSKFFPEGRTLTAQIEERGATLGRTHWLEQFALTGGFRRPVSLHRRSIPRTPYRPGPHDWRFEADHFAHPRYGVLARVPSLRRLRLVALGKIRRRLRAPTGRFSRRAAGY
jgi:hypothetical protein